MDNIATLCQADESQPTFGSGAECITTPSVVFAISKYYDLQDRPEFDVVPEGQNITIDDLLAYYLQQQQRIGSNFKITNQLDMNTNLTDPETNQVVQNNVPAKLVEYTYTTEFDTVNNKPDRIALVMLTVLSDPDTGKATGFDVFWRAGDTALRSKSPCKRRRFSARHINQFTIAQASI